MRTRQLFGALLIVLLLAFLGCGKSAPPPGQVHTIDASKLRPAFASAPAEAQAKVNEVMMAIQQSDFVGALGGLDQLSNTPSISAEQKKVVSDVIEQIKKKLSDVANSPAPTQ